MAGEGFRRWLQLDRFLLPSSAAAATAVTAAPSGEAKKPCKPCSACTATRKAKEQWYVNNAYRKYLLSLYGQCSHSLNDSPGYIVVAK